ncbi:MAG TPA: hypothetical protein VGH93_05260, partial [Solirubrobacteraceae bacterium]
MRFVLRRLLAEPLLVVLITRPDAADSLGEAWGRLLSDPDRVTRVHLNGLTTEGISELLSACGHSHVGQRVAKRLSEHTGGNPLHARALIDELGDSGLRAGGMLPAPRSFAQLTLGRLAALDGGAVQLTTAGTVLGSSFPVALAASLGEVDDPLAALDHAVSAGLLERAPDGHARFPHPLVRAAVYNDIPSSRLRALHLGAAASTEGARSLEHRVAAAVGSDDELAQALERRAFKEWWSGKGSIAYDHLMAAARLSSDTSARERRLLIGVEALFSSAEYGRAYATREIVMGCRESAHRSYILGVIDTTPQAEVHFSAAAAAADDKTDIPLLRLRAVGGRAVAHLHQGRFEAALGDANSALASGVEGWGSGLMRWVQVVSLANLGRTTEAWDVLKQREHSQPSATELDELCARSLLEMVDDDLPAVVKDLTALAARARAGETRRVMEVALSVLASAQYRLGQWDASAMSSELAVALYGEGVPVVHAVAALVHSGRGYFDLAEDDIRSAREADRAVPMAGGPYFVAMARAVLAQARGDLGELRAATAPLLDGQVQPTVEGLDL